MAEPESQIPEDGPLSILTENAWTGESENLRYGGELHLRRCYRIPLDVLHFNINNGRYRTRFLLLQKANPEAEIDPTQDQWKKEIHSMLSGTWEKTFQNAAIGTKRDRPHFENLVEDIREREQERPGVVLETGGVMSGNRRLAALMTLYSEAQEDRYRYFHAFIVPSSAGVTNADLWHLEMSAQMAQARLTRDYEPVERLLKIREGVEAFKELNPGQDHGSAVRAVAADFGQDEEYISKELSTIFNLEQYLKTIGHPGEWWLGEGMTEVFTEVSPLREALDKQAVPFEERGKVIRSVYSLIRNGEADYRLLRDVRAAVGGRAGSRSKSAVGRLTKSAPSTDELRKEPNAGSKAKAEERAESFRSEYQASKEREAPLAKANRAESNLEMLVDLIPRSIISGTKRTQLKKSVARSKDLSAKVLDILG